MSSSSPPEVVERHVAALNQGALADVLATFDQEAVFTSDGGTAAGHEELAALFRGVTGADRPTTVLRRTRETRHGLVCLLTRRFTLQDQHGNVAAAHDVEVHATFMVEDGLITHVRVDSPDDG